MNNPGDQEAKATNYETMRHIEAVRNNIDKAIRLLLTRGEQHDQTKMEGEELPYFLAATPKLKATTYNSPEYNKIKEEIKPALEHHYATYRHHPEHFADGINDMNLIDLIEMFCDWEASCKRHANGNILKSIEENRVRFKMSDQLVNIFKNTTTVFDNMRNNEGK